MRLRSVTAGAPDAPGADGSVAPVAVSDVWDGPSQPLAELLVAGAGRAAASQRCSPATWADPIIPHAVT